MTACSIVAGLCLQNASWAFVLYFSAFANKTRSSFMAYEIFANENVLCISRTPNIIRTRIFTFFFIAWRFDT